MVDNRWDNRSLPIELPLIFTILHVLFFLFFFTFHRSLLNPFRGQLYVGQIDYLPVYFIYLSLRFCDFLLLLFVITAITNSMPDQKRMYDDEVAKALQEQAREQLVLTKCLFVLFCLCTRSRSKVEARLYKKMDFICKQGML